MIDDFMSDNEVTEVNSLLGLNCQDEDLIDDITDVAIGKLTDFKNLIMLNWELYINKDLQGIFERMQELEHEKNGLFTLFIGKLKSFYFCKLLKRLDFEDFKAEIEQKIGGTIEEKIEEVKTVLEFDKLEEIDFDSMDMEQIETLIISEVTSSEEIVNKLDDSIRTFILDLLNKLIENDTEENYKISEELTEVINELELADVDYDLSEYLKKIIELIFSDMQTNSEDADEYLLNFQRDNDTDMKALLLGVEDADSLYDYALELDSKITSDMFDRIEKLIESLEDDEHITFKEFITLYQIVFVDIKEFMDLMFQNLTLVFFRGIDFKIREEANVKRLFMSQFEEDYANNYDWGDEAYSSLETKKLLYREIKFVKVNAYVEPSNRGLMLVNHIESSSRFNYIQPKSGANIISSRVLELRQLFLEDESGEELKKFYTAFYMQYIKDIFVFYINATNELKFRDVVIESMRNEQYIDKLDNYNNKKKMYKYVNHSKKEVCYSYVGNLNVVNAQNDSTDTVYHHRGGKIIGEFQGYRATDDFGIEHWYWNWSELESSLNGIKFYELLPKGEFNQSELYTALVSEFHNDKDFFNDWFHNSEVTELDAKIINVDFKYQDVMFDIYNSDDFRSIEDVTENEFTFENFIEDNFPTFNTYIKNLSTDINNIIDEVIKIYDDFVEEVNETVDSGLAWLRELIKKGF